MMLDCGEGTVNQLCSHFGDAVAAQVFKSMRAVFVSHRHADHHGGLLSLLRAVQANQSPSLLLIAEAIVIQSVRTREWNPGFLASSTPADANWPDGAAYNLLTSQFVRAFASVPVLHCKGAHGCALEIVVNHCARKIVYSGDTRPCNLLVRHRRSWRPPRHLPALPSGYDRKGSRRADPRSHIQRRPRARCQE
jgi:ribonuclease Z